MARLNFDFREVRSLKGGLMTITQPSQGRRICSYVTGRNNCQGRKRRVLRNSNDGDCGNSSVKECKLRRLSCLKFSMSLLRRKCTLAASRAAPW